MSSYLALRHVRHLSTAVTAVASQPVSISYTKNRLRNVHDPDEALKIYTDFTSANHHPSTSSISTRYAQKFTVRCLAKCHRFSDIEAFLESQKSQTNVTDETFFSSLIRSYSVAGMFENALKTYEQMTDLGAPRSSLSFNALLSACADSKVFDRVPAYFRELPAKFGFSPDKFSYGILIKSHCKMKSPEVAMEKLSEMEDKGIEVDAVVFNTILHCLYENGQRDEADKFWDEMVMRKGIKPDVVSFNVRFSHIHDGNPEAVKSFIDEMSNAGIKPDVISYNYFMSYYCKKGLMEEAKNVYDELLKSKGCNPNAATFRTLMFYMSKHEQFVMGYKVFRESVRRGKIPNFRVLRYLVKGLVKKGHESEAKSMIRTMNKRFPPDLLKDWEKVVDDLGLLARVEKTGEVNSDSGEIAKVPEDESMVRSTNKFPPNLLKGWGKLAESKEVISDSGEIDKVVDSKLRTRRLKASI